MSLAPDVPSTQSVIADVKGAMESLQRYAGAVAAIPTDQQEVPNPVVPGHFVVFDLSHVPQADAFQAAQTHAATLVDVVGGLRHWTRETIPSYARTFSATTDSILAAISQVKESATPDQRTAIVNGLTSLRGGLAVASAELRSVDAAARQFVEWMQADYATLTSGPFSLEIAMVFFDQAVDDMEGQLLSFEEKHKELEGARQVYREHFETVSDDLRKAGIASVQASPATSMLLNLIATLEAKYDSVVNDVVKADDSALASTVQRLDLRTAERAWSQLSSFIASAL